MSDLHKAITDKDIEKIQWCATIALYLKDKGWEFHEAYDLAEVLHYEYVELTGDECYPITTLEEEMTYWGD